ncbi:hypothetical protein RN001_014689 [Aquatica leii]|uniref:Uncharacterized protein n=1 Tax=Aquatica leii TaxID=1421715 RepID=A0AAN7PYQ9_9COLE|nr:hypothetical protein RN001_014689 [Aquatica leii]
MDSRRKRDDRQRRECKTYEEWKQVAEEEWGDSAYVHTKKVEGRSLQETTETSTLWVTEKEVEENTGLQEKTITDCFAMDLKTLVVAFVIVSKFSDSARILGVVPTPSYSHQVTFRPIWKELSLRGHQVVTITTDPIRDRNLINLTEIDISSAYDVWNKNIADITMTNPLNSLFLAIETLHNVSEHILAHHDVQKLIKNETEQFDVVIVEFTVMSMFAFAERFKAPLIVCSLFDASIDLHYLMGNPIHSMLYPFYVLPVHYNLLFSDRILVVLWNIFLKLISKESYALESNYVKKFFGDEYPPVTEYMQNISLVLSYSDPIFHKVKPLLPTIIEFGGGTHKVAPKPLPKELKNLLDSAEDGFIYFSLGSNVKSKFLSEHTQSVIMKTFAELPYTILWKFEDDDLPNKPENVITSKWLPQQDILIVKFSDGARILGVVPTPSYSHQVVFQPIWKQLSLRGHEVVTITTDPIRNSSLVNLTEIDIKSAYDVWNKNIVDMTNTNGFKSFYVITQTFAEVNEHVLSHRDVQNLIKNGTEYFDVVIVEYSLMSMFAFAERFNAPLIVAISIDAPIEIHRLMGNPIHPILYPSCALPVHTDASFLERIFIMMFSLVSQLILKAFFITQNTCIKTYFGDKYQPVTSLLENISLVLSNSDPIFHKIKPLLPTIVEFGGGSHRVAAKALPKDLKRVLDATENGFIYFSLGSNVKSKYLPEHTRMIFMETFAELPYTVLWKFENDTLLNKPNNVITSKWFPQQDVFKHPNIKLFITQGGLQSLDEALYDYVPMLIMPFFADQSFNAYRMVAKGCALSIDYETMTKDEFKTAILELIDNPKYKNRIMELAKLTQDQPMSGIEKAMWWIEYVIRHKGTAHLRSPYLDMPAYQYYYLDMIAVFGLAFLILIGVVPSPSYSHQVVFQPIWKELSLRGHEVVTITTDPIKNSSLVNLTEIDIKSAYDEFSKKIVDMTNSNVFKSFSVIIQTYTDLTDHVLSHRDVQNLIKNETEYFDVVIVEYSLMSMFAFAERFNAPLIAASSLDALIEIHHLMGNPIHFMLYPTFMLPVHTDMSFLERIFIVIFNVVYQLIMQTFYVAQNTFIKTYFGDKYQSIESLQKNISLVLCNSDPIFHKVKPLLPTIVEFGGGTHRVAPKPLPKDLERVLDAAKNGFIYFSLGSNVKSKDLSEDTRSIIMETFAELPYTVLWKFENDTLRNKPSNVITSKWFPQQDVFKHPNLKLFITQGGLQSIDEAIYDYVPMLIMPFFGDQRFNAYRIVAKGCALVIDYETMTKDEFKTAIVELIDNPKYKNRMMELAKLAQDQPMTGIEKAVWWIEYVIRHKGTAHLRSPYLDMPAYQYYYLDMIAVFGLAFFILFGVFVAIVKLLLKVLSLLFRRKTKAKAE